MDTRTAITRLSALLTRECDLVMTLVDVLSDEQACLIQIQAEPLMALAIQKETLMHDLERIHQQRLALCVEAGGGSSAPELDHWMRQLADGDLNLHCLIENFKGSLRQAQRLNNLNGTLVAEQLGTLQQRMAIIQQASQATPNVTYGPNGLFGSSSPFTSKSHGVR